MKLSTAFSVSLKKTKSGKKYFIIPYSRLPMTFQFSSVRRFFFEIRIKNRNVMEMFILLGILLTLIPNKGIVLIVLKNSF